MNYDKIDLAWAGGLFDGEGSISHHRTNGGIRGSVLEYPQVILAMADEDLVRWFHEVVGVGTITIRKPPPEGPGKLPLWVWNANSFEHCQFVVALLWPYLGVRRRARAVEVFKIVKESQAHRKYERRGTECGEPGCTKPVQARGLCHSHYRIASYAKRRDTPCVIDGCTNRPNGSRGRCRWHTKHPVEEAHV